MNFVRTWGSTIVFDNCFCGKKLENAKGVITKIVHVYHVCFTNNFKFTKKGYHNRFFQILEVLYIVEIFGDFAFCATKIASFGLLFDL